ncbi:MAG: Hint domain-containing protein [Roseovarius sp.]
MPFAASNHIFVSWNYLFWLTLLEHRMPDGFLVALGNDTIDPGDAVAPTGPSTFIGAQFLGTGIVRWSNGGNSSATSGDFFLADDGSVYFVPDFGPIAGVQGGTSSVQSFSGSQPPVPCFVSGTMIDTPDGSKPVETLVVGQYVTVYGHAPQPILWHGHRDIKRPALQRLTAGLPIELKFNGGLCKLKVSPQHAIYLDFPNGGMLVRAQQLLRLRRLGARQMRGVRRLRYHHLLLPRHHLVRANGIWCESLYPGPRACAGFSQDQRDGLLAFNVGDYGPPAAPYAKIKELRDLTGRDFERLLAMTNSGAHPLIALAS